ncbi:MAG: hypothetical protein NTW66_00515 [Candidatus Magasanikbacteria bacterium]|nr:hypothetical protein [Candidatus Magasanikbacteria bacterium]
MRYLPLYRLRDFDRAVILYASGAILNGLEWDDLKREAQFVFEDEPFCLSVLRKHDEYRLKIDSHKWIEARREINSALYNR